jgi:hypothetical protein
MHGAITGCQTPTYAWTPLDDEAFRSYVDDGGRPRLIYDAGQDTIDFARDCGLLLDPWEQVVIRGASGEYADEQWVTNEVGLIVPRQNGKGAIIEARELSGIFLFGDRLILHSAHQFNTARDAFGRMKARIESNPDLDSALIRVDNSKGEEGFTFRIRHEDPDSRCLRCRMTDTSEHIARLRYMARSASAGRGFTGATTVILDEVMILDDAPIAALLPTMATEPKWQVWYTGSAGDIKLPTSSVVQARVRRRGYQRDPSLAFYEWFAHIRHTKDCPSDCVLDDRESPKTYAKTNPSLGIVRPDGSRGTTVDFLNKMRNSMSVWDFDREFLSVGEYPADEGWMVIGKELWAELEDPEIVGSGFPRPFAVGIECAWDWSSSSVSIAAERDGVLYIECIANRAGTGWVPGFCAELKRKRPLAFVVDRKGPARIIMPDLEAERINVTSASTDDHITWAGKIYDRATRERSLRHLGQDSMNEGVRVARKRLMANRAFAWERVDLPGDGTSWIAATMAYGGLITNGGRGRRRPLVASGGPVGPAARSY